MLFSKKCGCVSPRPPDSRNGNFDRRDLLCAGGAGFVAAVVATLTGASKIARAQALGRTVPQVDRLAVRIVTDNYVFFFAPKESLRDLSVERLGPQLNDQPPRKDLAAEFGLSFHVETQRGAEVRGVNACLAERLTRNSKLRPPLAASVRFGSWLCENAATRERERTKVRSSDCWSCKDSKACPISTESGKIILVVFQFSAFSHSLGH
jgi:hypothetical protein